MKMEFMLYLYILKLYFIGSFLKYLRKVKVKYT